MPNQDRYDVRAQMLETLMQKLQADQYPSSTMLDMIEELLTPDDVPAYVEELLGRVRSDQFPSIPVLNRVKSRT